PIKKAVVTVGKFVAGTSFNIIADKATLIGTVRYLDETVQEKVRQEMERIVQGVCLTNNVQYDFQYTEGYPPVRNDEATTKLVLDAAQNIPEIKDLQVVEPQMGGEDFAYYLER